MARKPPKKSRPRSIADVQIARLEHERRMHATHHAFGLVREIVRRSPWFAMMYFGWRSVEAIAGKTTVFESNLMWVLKLGANRFFLLAVVALAGGSYMLRGRLKRRAVRGLQHHVKVLETKIDPKRSSSKLTADGTPTPEDLNDS